MVKGMKMKKHPILLSVVIALLCGMVAAFFFGIEIVAWNHYDSIMDFVIKAIPNLLQSILLYGVLFGVFIFYPVILTFINLKGMFCLPKEKAEYRVARYFEGITFVLGILFTQIYMSFFGIRIDAEWSVQLVNSEVHQPIWTGGAATIVILSMVGVIGYTILAWGKLEKLPPLVTVLSMSAMYLGLLVCILWMVQTLDIDNWVLSILPLNCLMIGFKIIRFKICEWKQLQAERVKATETQDVSPERTVAADGLKNAYPNKPLLNLCHNILIRAEVWPFLALILMIPLLGILLSVLILFGQKPDAIIKAWTETAEWRLSQQIAPQNAMYDEHYLCTVAAGGHEKIVKPIRMGERHGHRVVVNRQLCIANAFEQILEERTPKFHRAVRNFYDTYGFPLSGVIKTKGAADVTYILMKPLEWIFLIVIYLCDAKPENRIAVQYLPRI